jgi:protein ImuB
VCRYGDTSQGPIVVPPSESWPAIAPLPIEALRISPATAKLLRQLGVRCVQQAAELPREALAARLPRASFSDGAACELAARLDQALCAAAELISPHREPPEFFAERALEYPLERQEAIESVTRSLLEELSQQLLRRRRGVMRLACRLDCVGGPLRLEVDLFRPSASPKRLMELFQLRLGRTRLPGPVGRIGAQAPITAPLEERQVELFADPRRQAADALGSLVERLSGRLGRERVLRPRLKADPLPELACRYVPWTGAVEPAPSEPPEAAPRRFGGGERPLAAQARPTPIAVVAIAPLGPPISFHWQGRRFRVARCWGPERIETGWWRGPLERRDYYRVETPSGARFWLFRRLNDGQWFFQGKFE